MEGEKPYVYQETGLPAELQALIDDAFRVVWPNDLASDPDLRKKVQGVLVIKRPSITAEFLESMPALKVLGNHGVGYDRIPVALCRERGVRVGTTPGVLSDTTADMAFALLLAAARRVVEGNALAKDPQTAAFDLNWFGFQVSGAALGIVGMGRIGYEVARRARGFNMKVLYHNRKPCSKEVEEGVQATYVPGLHDLLSQSDFVVLAAPGSKENFRMFGQAEFAAMKKGAVFVNIARGTLVDQDALTHSLQQGHLGAVGLDVTDPEPLPRDHPLLAMTNVTLTPHSGKVEWYSVHVRISEVMSPLIDCHSTLTLLITTCSYLCTSGSATMHTRAKMVKMCIDNILAGIRDQTMPHEVTE